MNELYEYLYELIEEIKNEETYIAFKQAEERLMKEQNKELLLKNKELQEKYLELRKYENQTDLSDIKSELKEIKNQMAMNPDIQKYYFCYRNLNDRLQEISKLLFKNISEDLSFDYFDL